LDGCLGAEPITGLALAEGLCDTLGGGGWDHFGGTCPFSFIPWHLPYNWGKARKTSVRVAEQCWVLLVASTWPSCRSGLDRPAVHPPSSVDREGLQTAPGRCIPSCRKKESPNPREFARYQRTKVRWSQCEDTWTVALAASGHGCGPPDRACVVHHTTDELLVEQHAVSDGQATSSVKERTEHAQSSCRLSSYPVDMRRLSRHRAVSIHATGSPRKWTGLGLWMRLVNSIAVLLETLIEILRSRSQCSSLQR
jgi:hypothetical protein